MSCGCNDITKLGANPISTQWTIVKGNTATLTLSFYELDESTYFDTSSWSYSANVYDKYNDSLDELDVIESNGYISVIASSAMTSNWGPVNTFSNAELKFEIKVIIPQSGEDDLVWTPVLGTINLINDISSGGSL